MRPTVPSGVLVTSLSPDLRRRIARLGGRGVPPALVLECSYVNGLSAIRALAGAGVPVVALDHRRQALGLRSRQAVPVVCPRPDEDPAGFASLLHEVAEALGRPAVAFPTHDEYLVAVNRDAPEGMLLPFGPRGLIDPIQAKRFQYDAADRAGVLLPATFHPRSEDEALDAASRIRYPAVMKPSLGAGFKRLHGTPLIEAQNAGELLSAYREGAAFDPMLQEKIPGGDDCLWTVGSYLAADGRALGVFCGRKLLQAPAGVGTCRVGEAIWDQTAVDGALALLRELGFHGISQVEYKRDPRDGTLRLMEVNARLWQWHSLARSCGVDLVGIAYRDTVGLPVAPATSERAGRRRWVALVRHLKESRRDRLSLRATLEPLRPPFQEPVLSLRDPMPAVHQVYGAVRSGGHA
jgi:predicted ATP-grasp superfamily ATP-dependent carboligase